MKPAIVFLSLLVGISAHAAKVPVNSSITPNDPLPVRVLDCGGAEITNIADRFGNPIGLTNSKGSTVTLNNTGYVVSYDLIPAIRDSRVGDHVLVCLVFIPDPDKCPPSDLRGRVYTMTNLRTLESWSLADSQHECGGA